MRFVLLIGTLQLITWHLHFHLGSATQVTLDIVKILLVANSAPRTHFQLQILLQWL